ncbi:MAG: amidase [Dehalococcoidia bacterium]
MPSATDLCFLSAAELAPMIEAREVSPVELVEAQLDRIAEQDEVLRAFIHVDREGALKQARAAEAEIASGSYRGPLHGITVAHKDIIDVRGMPTTGASRVIAPRIATEDATVQARLRAAGAICLGKLNLIEFASGSMGVYGFARNPWDLAAYPGGSSSGSGTALASGLVTIATGTDTGGSVRNPACFCGLAGMRATYGRVSRHGCIPLSWSQDSIGPMARSVADAALMLEVMAGPDRRDATAAARTVPDFSADLLQGAAGLRVGVPDSFFFDDLDPEIEAALDEAIARMKDLGAHISEVSLPASEYASAASWTIAYSESFVFHREWFETRSKDYTPAFYHKIAAAGLTSAPERIVSQQVRQAVTREFAGVMRDIDVIVTPTSRTLAPADRRADQPVSHSSRWQADMASVTRPLSLTGYPAMSVPIGFARDGTPMGMQLVGRPWEEATLFRLGHAYEKLAGWSSRRPPAIPARVPPRYGSASVPPVVVEDGSPVGAAWVMGMARLLGYGFISEEDARAIAPMLAPVKDQLAEARRSLRLDLEPPTRAAGWPFAG